MIHGPLVLRQANIRLPEYYDHVYTFRAKKKSSLMPLFWLTEINLHLGNQHFVHHMNHTITSLDICS